MSMFDSAKLCFECKLDEREAPGYDAAVAAEADAVARGEETFIGVGLSIEARKFLSRKREARRENDRKT